MLYRRNTVYLLSVLLLATGLISGRAFFLKASYVLIALSIVSLVYSWMSVNWLSINRQTYVRRIQVGQIFEERFRVGNQFFVPKLWLEVRDHSTLPDHQSSHVVPMLTYNQNYDWQVQTMCTRRGQFTLGPMTITSGDPFGLYQFPRHIASTSTVIVYPITFPIYDFATPTGALTGGQAVRRLSYQVTPHAAGIREYAPGDSFKRIHWKSTARRGKLFVKEFEMDPLGDVWIFLDLSVESLVERPSVYSNHSTHLPPSTMEYAISAAASLSQYFIDNNRNVGFLTYAPNRNYVAPDRGDRQLTDILEVLATANATNQLSLGQMLSLEGPHISRGATAIVITSSTNVQWLAEAHIQSRRGLMMLAVLVDPTSFGLQGVNFGALRQQVESSGVSTYVVRQGDDLTVALSDSLSRNGH